MLFVLRMGFFGKDENFRLCFGDVDNSPQELGSRGYFRRETGSKVVP